MNQVHSGQLCGVCNYSGLRGRSHKNGQQRSVVHEDKLIAAGRLRLLAELPHGLVKALAEGKHCHEVGFLSVRGVCVDVDCLVD